MNYEKKLGRLEAQIRPEPKTKKAAETDELKTAMAEARSRLFGRGN